MERRIDKLNWREIKKLKKNCDLALLPIGTLEAHSITSNGTDTIIPEYICEKLAENLNGLIYPPVNYSITSSLLPYPGTVTLKDETFEKLIFDIALSVKKDKFKYLVIINGHGGNNKVLSDLKKKIFLETGMFVIIIHWWIVGYPVCREVFGKEGGHGGVDETAMVNVIDEKQVFKEYLKDEKLYYKVVDGVDTIPAPASTILYSENDGKIDLDTKKSKKYCNLVIEKINKIIVEDLENFRNYFD